MNAFLQFQQCGTGFFTCFNGSMTCTDEVFRCDCEHDCDDGSDEDITWAGCNPTQAALCSAGKVKTVIED